MLCFPTGISQLQNGEGLFGRTGLVEYARGSLCCSVHRDYSDVCSGAQDSYLGAKGTHPAFALAGTGVNVCCAEKKTLGIDREFLGLCSSFWVPGSQFRAKALLRDVRKYATGTVTNLASFGVGYCYLQLIRPEFRFRVARILGPLPLLADFLMVYRLAGVCSSRSELVFVGQGLLHVKTAVDVVEGKDVWKELHGLLEMDENVRIGVENQNYGTVAGARIQGDGTRCEIGGEVQLDSAMKDGSESALARGHCMKCNCIVRVDGHAERCRVPYKRDSAVTLVGDAQHALDVKSVVAGALPPGSHFTVVASAYLSAAAQRRYLDMVDGVVTGFYSDHTYGDMFESRYKGAFRREYLYWLASDIEGVYGGDVARRVRAVVVDVAERSSALDGSVKKPGRREGCDLSYEEASEFASAMVGLDGVASSARGFGNSSFVDTGDTSGYSGACDWFIQIAIVTSLCFIGFIVGTYLS